MTNDNHNTTALHEAGHAIIGYLVGHQIERAFVGDDPEGDVSAGTAEGGIALRLVGDWRHAVFVGVAGWCAEEVALPGIQADRGYDADFCRETLQEAGFSEWHADAFLEWACVVVREQLRAHHTALKAVADWLTRHGDMDGETLAAIISAYPTDQPAKTPSDKA